MDVKKAVIDLAPAPVVRFFAAPYVAGKGIESGLGKADEIWKAGRLSSTLDLLGEEVFRREDDMLTLRMHMFKGSPRQTNGLSKRAQTPLVL